MPGFGDDHAPGRPYIDPSATPGDRTYCMFIHLMLPIATVTVLPMIFGPLVMWLLRRSDSRFIDDHGKEALNFNFSVLIYLILCVLLIPACGIGFVLMPVLWVVASILSIIAAIATNRGEWYRYPACIRILG